MNHKSSHNKDSMSNRVFVVLQSYDFSKIKKLTSDKVAFLPGK